MYKLLLTLFLFLISANFASASDLYFSQPNSDSQTFFGRYSGIYYMGLTFQNPSQYDLCQIKLKVSRGGSGHNDGVYINLYQVNNNSIPNSGTLIASSNGISAGNLPSAHNFVTFTFGADICYSLQANTRYGITLHRWGANSDSAYYIQYSQYNTSQAQYFASYRTSWSALSTYSNYLQPAMQTYGNPPFTYEAQDFSISLSGDFYPQQYDSNKLLPYTSNNIDYTLRPKNTLLDYSVKAIPFLVFQRVGNYDTTLYLSTTSSLPFDLNTQKDYSNDFTEKGQFFPFYLSHQLSPNDKIYYKYYYWIDHEEQGAYMVESDIYSIQYINQSTSTTPLYSTSSPTFDLPNVSAVYDRTNCNDNILTQIYCSTIDAVLFLVWPNDSTSQAFNNLTNSFSGINVFQKINSFKDEIISMKDQIDDFGDPITLGFDVPSIGSSSIHINYLDLSSEPVIEYANSLRPYMVFTLTFFFFLYSLKRFKAVIRTFLD